MSSSLTRQPEFIISMHVVAKVVAANVGLCRFLQKENIDLVHALAVADSILAILEDMRANAECVYADLSYLQRLQRYAGIFMLSSLSRISVRGS